MMVKKIAGATEIMNRKTRAVITSGQELRGIGTPELIRTLGIGNSTFYARKQNTDDFRLGDIRRMARVLDLSDQDIITIVRGK